MEKCIATRYLRENRIKATITHVGKKGFEYMLYNGECYYITYDLCV